MERERACAAGGSRSRYYYYSALTTNIECNKKSARNSTLIPGKNVSRDLGVPFIYTFIHTHTFLL